MGKIIGKSALAFAGLGVAGWLMNLLDHFIFYSGTDNHDYFFGMAKVTLLLYLPWLALALGYAIVLFLLFRNEKHRTLIMTLNAAAVIFVPYALLIPIGRGLMVFSIAQSAGIPVMLLALLMGWIFPGQKKKNRGVWSGASGIVLALLKSFLCLGVVVGLAFVAGAFFIESKYPQPIHVWAAPFIEYRPVFFSIAIVYACLLNKLTADHKRPLLVMLVNALVLVAIWSLMLMFGFLSEGNMYHLYLVIACGNTAVVTFALAFVFRGMEKLRECNGTLRAESGLAGYRVSEE